MHSLTWEEAQIAAGVDPDFHRRDLYDAIENGAFPEWDLGVQVFPDTPEETFEGIDLLDPTKIVPEELAPVQVIGTLVLNGNPTNFFAETEQVAFHTGHLVPGIEGTNDPLLQGRNFSYLDTQLTRLGGPELHPDPDQPAARPGQRQHPGRLPPAGGPHRAGAVHARTASTTASRSRRTGPRAATSTCPRHVEGDVVRAAPASFDDHFSQPAMFYASLTSVEQQHIVDAYTFELGKCYEQAIKERALTVLAKLDENLCTQVAAGLGPAGADARAGRARRAESPALRQIKPTPFPIAGRIVGVVAGPGADLDGIATLRTALEAEGALLRVIAPHGGQLVKGKQRRDRRADLRHRPVDRVRRDRRRRRRTEGRRLPRAGHAAGGVPAPEGRRRLGRRRRGARRPPASTRGHRASCSTGKTAARS